MSKKRAAELMLEELRKLPALPPTTLVRVKRKPTTKKKSRNLIKVGQEASILPELLRLLVDFFDPLNGGRDAGAPVNVPRSFIKSY